MKVRCRAKLSASQLVARHRLISNASKLTGVAMGGSRRARSPVHGFNKYDGADERDDLELLPHASGGVDDQLTAPGPAAPEQQEGNGDGISEADLTTHDHPMDEEALDAPEAAHPFEEPPPEDIILWRNASSMELERHERTHEPHADETMRSSMASDRGSVCDERHNQLDRRVRRRLGTKTPSSLTVYGNEGDRTVTETRNDLMTRREAQADCNRREAKRRKTAQEQRLVEGRALEHLERNLGLIAPSTLDEQKPEDETCDDFLTGPAFHESHAIQLSRQSGVAFCRTCVAWTTGRKARRLKVVCPGSCNQPYLLRRLVLGLPPVGARIPAELERPGSRGTRGGR